MKLEDLNPRDAQFIGSILYAIALNPVLANTISHAMNMEVCSFDERAGEMFAELYPPSRENNYHERQVAGFN